MDDIRAILETLKEIQKDAKNLQGSSWHKENVDKSLENAIVWLEALLR